MDVRIKGLPTVIVAACAVMECGRADSLRGRYEGEELQVVREGGRVYGQTGMGGTELWYPCREAESEDHPSRPEDQAHKEVER